MSAYTRPKVSVFIASSIDGYIAKANGDLDWLISFNPPSDPNEEQDCGYGKFFASVDALVMGTNSYQVVSRFDQWPYEGKRVIVLSSTLDSVCEHAELYSGDIQTLMTRLLEEGVRHVYVDGGRTISSFLNAGLVDEMIISIIPVVLGSGIPLFSQIEKEKWFRLISSRAYSNGLLQNHYQLVYK